MRCLLEASWLSQRRHRSEIFQVSKPSNNNRLLAYHRQTCSVDSNRISPFAELSLGSSPSTRVIDLKLVADCFNHLELTSRSACLGLSIGSKLARGCSLKKKSQKNPKFFFFKSKDFFEDLKSVHLTWKWTTHRIQCLNIFLFIKSSFTQNKSRKKSKKSEKNPKYS